MKVLFKTFFLGSWYFSPLLLRLVYDTLKITDNQLIHDYLWTLSDGE